jgi:hypothetical protein
MKLRFSLGLVLSGFTFLAAQPVLAASLSINDTGPDPNVVISAGQFEGGFSVNGTQIQPPSNVATGSVTVSENGSFVNGAAQNTFSGSWEDPTGFTAANQTVFFLDSGGNISDVLHYVYTATTVDGVAGGLLTGYFISDNDSVGALSGAALAALGITPTQTVSETSPFIFDNSFLTASAQSNADAGGVPESSTWAMMIVGFATLGFAAHRRRRNRLDAAFV